jgi:cytochrome c553
MRADREASVSRAAVAVALAGALSGCRTDQTIVTPDPHLERMLRQEKLLPYERDALLPGGLSMQLPPEGTLADDAVVGDPRLTTGVDNDHWVAHIPVHLGRDDLDAGRQRFDTFCAACHGILGDGASVVADKMALRPRDLVAPPVTGYTPGRIFQTIREGYGLMPSYAVQLSIADTWKVVGYLEALQLARAAKVADLPADVRERLAKEAP